MRPSTKAWVGIAVYVSTYDVWAVYTDNQTMSKAFWEASRHPKRRWLVLTSWAFLTGHLFGLVPERYDPLKNIPLPFR